MDYNGPPAAPGMCHVCNSIWMLSDFTAENGATRVVFGKRLSGQTPDVLADPGATHPEEMLLLGKAGTVVVNSHSLTNFFCRRDDPHMVLSSALSVAAKARLSAAARCLFRIPSRGRPDMTGKSSVTHHANLRLGLNALGRADDLDYFTDGHRGGAIISGYYLCREAPVDEGVADAIDSQWAGTPLCADFPDERAYPELTQRVVEAMLANITGLRQVGHNVILPTLALKACRDDPDVAMGSAFSRLVGIVQEAALAEPLQQRGAVGGIKDLPQDNRRNLAGRQRHQWLSVEMRGELGGAALL